MEVVETPLAGALILKPRRFEDARGFFCEVYNKKAFEAAGVGAVFVQDNHSLSIDAGVVRGLHYQIAPSPQAKLVRVVAGSILDVIVDVRRKSPTFGQHVAVELSRANNAQLFVPVGFAHGFVTLEPNTEVLYKVTTPWDRDAERGVRWNDPALGINWGIDETKAVLSDKDKQHPLFADVSDWF